MGKTCSVDGCQRRYESSGYCSLHRTRWRRYGDPLAQLVRPRGTVEERARTKFVEGAPDECWPWTANLTHDGYGMLGPGGANPPRQLYAHRVVFELYGGVIPDGYELDHLCRVRNCVNPAHLEPVTRTENRRRQRMPHDPVTGRFVSAVSRD